jgi:hypothetical protein
VPQEITISRNEAIIQVLAQLQEPATVNFVVEQVLALWPSKAKNPATGVRQALRGWDHAGKSLVFLDDQTIAPINIALKGVTFRIPLSRQEVKQGILLVRPGFTGFLSQWDTPEGVEFLDVTGQSLAGQVVSLKQTNKSVFGSYTYEYFAFDLSKWFKKRKVKRDDSLLVTIENWEAKQFRLAHEPAKARKRHRAEIESRNQELANIFFDLLESAKYEDIRGDVAALTAYARLSDPSGYPGDHWLDVVEKDERMRWDGSSIRYPDWYSPIEQIFVEPEAQQVQEAAYSPGQGEQVYRFKAAFKNRKGLWRRIEIQGKQTLADFDRELRDAFQHDTFDHLSGFWKLVRRGKSRRFRQVDLGNVNSFEGGEADDLAIAGLGLEPGQQLKYVYDFGDWIEHRITLEEIIEPEKGVEYPRVAGQNKPRYRYCHHCKKEGKKTVATRICIECSDMEMERVLVCKNCLHKHHSEHYADEIIY